MRDKHDKATTDLFTTPDAPVDMHRLRTIEHCAERLLEALDQRFPMPIRRDTVAREMLALRAAISGAHEEN